MEVKKKKLNTKILLYLILVATLLINYLYLQTQREMAHATYSNTETIVDTQHITEVTLEGYDSSIYITEWDIFSDDNIWTYSGLGTAYDDDFTPPKLADVTVAHSLDEDAKVQSFLNNTIELLFDDAADAGHGLIIASAYRSIEGQRDLYQTFVAARGAEAAAGFVATPGESEHHTGLAVDFNTYSPDCLADSFACMLDPAASEWLRTNARRYGFILRYPEGKSAITGINGEAWHYRYVGQVLAKALYESDITFDEFVMQAAPGRIAR